MEGGEADEIATVVVERNRLWGALTLASFFAAPLFVVASSGVWQTLSTLATMMATLPLVPLFGWLTYHSPRRTDGTLRVDADGMVLTTPRGARRLPRGSFRSGTSFATPSGAHVVVLRTGRRLGMRLEVQRDGHVRSILGAAGVDRRAGTTRFSVRLCSRLPQIVGVSAVTAVIAAHAYLPVGGPATFLVLWLLGLAATLLAWLTTHATLTVGADGIDVKPWIGRRRFVAHADIDGVIATLPPVNQLVSRGFVVTKSNGERIFELDTRGERFRGGVWQTDPVHDAVQSAWGAARGKASSSSALAQLGAGEASTKAWIARLRAAGAGEQRADYRAPALDERALLDVVNDAGAAPGIRAAAAVALSASPEHAPKLRVMADDIADEKIRRIAIAASESEREDELEAEMEPLNRLRRG